ncbi:MAG: hypothetical protein GX620_03695 [Chloroflexi bacterium]|nr:hypothetical protein [Chloroflexota bacterium]
MKVGVYIHDGFTFEPREECPYYWGLDEYERYLDWLRYAGVEIVEACQQLGWYRYPTLPQELDRLRARQSLVGASHARDMAYWQILGANLNSRLPVDQAPPGQLDIRESDCTECPLEDGGFLRTAELGRYFARCFRGADAFEVFAGDWGGCGCGRCGVDQYARYVQYHAEHLAQEQPAAQVWANVWSISSWQKRSEGSAQSFGDDRWRKMWDDEIAFSQQFLAALDEAPPNVGVAFPLHHWYRGFCQRWYREDELPFWPTIELLEDLHRRGRPLLAWTHFIVENDPYHGRLWGTLSVRLRYLRQLCQMLAQAPFAAVMGNVYSARQALNLYAFTRFVRQPESSVEQVLSGFVDEVALPAGRALLFDLLVYLENRDPWHDDMPEYRRLPALPEAGLRVDQLRQGLDGLATQIRRDSPLLLNGPDNFVRTLSEALALSESG